jgi:hypothetical protein
MHEALDLIPSTATNKTKQNHENPKRKIPSSF